MASNVNLTGVPGASAQTISGSAVIPFGVGGNMNAADIRAALGQSEMGASNRATANNVRNARYVFNALQR
jgi:hypothetical protein